MGCISVTGKRASNWLSHRRRLLTSLVVVALAGFGVTAFGIAPLSIDEAPLPRRVISEPLPLPGLDAQLDALAAQELELTRTTFTQSGDTVDRLLQRLGVSDRAAASFLQTDRTARRVIVRDFQAFARQTGNDLVEQTAVGEEFLHYLRRR